MHVIVPDRVFRRAINAIPDCDASSLMAQYNIKDYTGLPVFPNSLLSDSLERNAFRWNVEFLSEADATMFMLRWS
jgi:hypothetical protein